MSAEGFEPSIWDRQEGNSEAIPKYCPHCGEELAHPDNLRENDDIEAAGYGKAYREHRAAHFNWGVDPAEIHEDGDPYLAKNYDGVQDGEGGPKLDRDEEVAGVYDVDIRFEAVVRARVVAGDKGDARDRADQLRIDGEADLDGWVPTAEITHKLHDEATEIRRLTRGEIDDSSEVNENEDKGINFADRLRGWPW